MSDVLVLTEDDKKVDLLEIATNEGVPGVEDLNKPGVSKQAVVDAINAHRGDETAPAVDQTATETTDDAGSGDEGETSPPEGTGNPPAVDAPVVDANDEVEDHVDEACPNPSCGSGQYDGNDCPVCGYAQSAITRQFNII